MKRLYYLTGNLDSTEEISNDIHAAGITDWHFHVISKDEAGLYRRPLRGMERGEASGPSSPRKSERRAGSR